MSNSRLLALAMSAAALFSFAGCTSNNPAPAAGRPVVEMGADEKGFVVGTGIESQDLVSVSEKMARSIVAIPQIAHAANPPVIALAPVQNKTRFPINKDIFLTRLRMRLSAQAAGQVQFLARDRMATLEDERNRKIVGEVTSASDPSAVEFKGADYLLTGTLDSISTRTSQGQSDYVLYSFQLIDARTGVIVWEDAAEIKKQGLEDAAYR